MGQHRTTGQTQRGVSRGVIVSILTVIVVVALLIAWFVLGRTVDSQGDAAAKRCVAGDSTVAVLADATIADPLKSIAASYNSTRPVARDHCVTIVVRPSDSVTTLRGLTGSWDKAMGDFPAAWVPQSSIWSTRLTNASQTLVSGDPQSLVTSPVVVAIPFATPTPAHLIGWRDLPSLQGSPSALRRYGLPNWGSLRMAMPASSDATVLAAQAIAADIQRSPKLTPAIASSPGIVSAISGMLRSAHRGGGDTTADALRALGNDVAASIHAVAVTEQQLYASASRGTPPIARAYRPTGPTPVADYPFIRLSGNLVSDEKLDAASDFLSFLRRPANVAVLTHAGFRGDRPLPPATEAVAFDAVGPRLSVSDAAATTSIAKLIDRRR